MTVFTVKLDHLTHEERVVSGFRKKKTSCSCTSEYGSTPVTGQAV